MIKFISNIMHTKKSKPPKNILQIVIKCILYDLSDFNDKDIHNIRDYCIEKNVLFSTRRFNSNKYSDDRNYILKLPAFHVIINDSYIETFYINTRPFQHIDKAIQKYNDIIEKKQKNKEAWKNYYNNFINMFKKESLMDKNERIKNKEEKKRLKKEAETKEVEYKRFMLTGGF